MHHDSPEAEAEAALEAIAEDTALEAPTSAFEHHQSNAGELTSSARAHQLSADQTHYASSSASSSNDDPSNARRDDSSRRMVRGDSAQSLDLNRPSFTAKARKAFPRLFSRSSEDTEEMQEHRGAQSQGGDDADVGEGTSLLSQQEADDSSSKLQQAFDVEASTPGERKAGLNDNDAKSPDRAWYRDKEVGPFCAFAMRLASFCCIFSQSCT